MHYILAVCMAAGGLWGLQRAVRAKLKERDSCARNSSTSTLVLDNVGKSAKPDIHDLALGPLNRYDCPRPCRDPVLTVGAWKRIHLV